MSRFYVGQRVRVVAANYSKHLIGKETVIVGWRDDGWDGKKFYSGWDTALSSLDGLSFIAKPGQLEPILYDGNQLVSWEECLWQPSGVEA